MISYLPKGKWTDVENPWLRKTAGRQDARPAKLVRTLLTKEALADLNDKDWEAFASRIKGVAEADKVEIRLVTGEDIRHWYHEDHYGYGAGDLNNSCMRYRKQQPFFDFYTMNPNQIAMLCAVRDERLYARALVWTTVSGARVHDRIYGNEATRSALADWLSDEGIRRVGGEDAVQVDNPWHRHYPYLDSMGHMDADGIMYSRSKPGTIYIGGTGGGMDLRDGPPKCAECGKVRPWGDNRNMCDECRDRKRREKHQAWVDKFTIAKPATLTYEEYCQIPGPMMRTNRRVIEILGSDGDVILTYRYRPDRGINAANLFELEDAPVTV
jgi:hypothetical protein